jgi:queuine tRNA-ribosyltransferase
MPVGTQGAIKAFDHSFLESIGYQLILANTYYLVQRPGLDILRERDGLKKFMNLDAALLTDSGGFQAYSLSPLVKFREDGIQFRSHFDGSLYLFTPESVLEAQRIIGSDIRMLLDEVAPFGADKKKFKEAVKRTGIWARQSIQALMKEKAENRLPLHNGLGLAFAIMQGGFFPDLRQEAARELLELDFPGYAVGGLSVGENRAIFMDMAYLSGALLPDHKPRYIMGVGAVQDLITAMDAGFDMFDCVLPTRNARNGSFLTSLGEQNIRNARFKNFHEPIDPICSCRICHTYSASYLHHLFRSREILAPMVATEHNLFFMQNFVKEARQSIWDNSFPSFQSKWLQYYPLAKGKRGIKNEPIVQI